MNSSLSKLNGMSKVEFVTLVGPVFEHSPWIAERAHAFAPFASIAALHGVMKEVVKRASAEERMSLIRAHPDLVGRLAREGKLTHESTREQAAAGLSGLTPAEVKQFEDYNAAYRERFGFPFIVCARQNKKDAILKAFPVRLQNDSEWELATALGEVYKIAELRLRDVLTE